MTVRFSEVPVGAKFWLEGSSTFWWRKIKCEGASPRDVYCNAEHGLIRQYFPPDKTVWVERN